MMVQSETKGVWESAPRHVEGFPYYYCTITRNRSTLSAQACVESAARSDVLHGTSLTVFEKGD